MVDVKQVDREALGKAVTETGDPGSPSLKIHAMAALQALATQREAYEARIAELERERDALRLEAQCHAMEARSQRATVHEGYQIVSGATGEPGDWHGAEPFRKLKERAEAAESRLASYDALVEALEKIKEKWITNNSEGDDWEEGFDDGLKACHDIAIDALKKVGR